MSYVSGEPKRHPPVVSSVCTDHGVYSGTLVDPISANIEQGNHRRNSSSSSSSVTDTSDPAVRRVVYNLYRGLLGTYNDKANDIISSMPPEMVCEDQGIAKHIESMIQHSEEIKSGVGRKSCVNNSSFQVEEKSGVHPSLGVRPLENTINMDASICQEGKTDGAFVQAGLPPPPPPPPPPPMPNQGISNMPTIKINSEGGGPKSSGKVSGGKHLPGGGVPFSYIPPSAIQNAMMTKDKKPFTYTPGGIDFLAEIRSPRMQRRISKNAADEGVASHSNQTTNVPGSSSKPTQLSPQALMAMQPQMAVPVFPPMPQQMPVAHPIVMPSSVASPPPTIIASLLSPSLPAMQQGLPQQQSAETPQPMRMNVKPAPQFVQSLPQTQLPEQMFEEIMNSLSVRNTGSQVHRPSLTQPSVQSIAPSVPPIIPVTERRNVQLGSLYIPPVNGTGSGGGPNVNNSNGNAMSGCISPLATAQLAKAPMPWMNSQNRTSNPPTPTFVHNQQERVIPEEREENIKSAQNFSSGNVRLVPILVEGGRTGATASMVPPIPQRNLHVKDEVVHPPWYDAPGKVIPIYMESVGPSTPTPSPTQSQRQPDTYQQLPHLQQQAPWRTQATANANQIASMMEELMMSPNSNQQHEHCRDSSSTPLAGSYIRPISVEQPRGQPTQSRSFRILQMIHDDPTDDSADAEAEPTENSGRLSQSSVGSNNSGGASGGRVSQQSGPPPIGERRLNLTQDDRELMDMFRSQVNEEQSLHQEVDPRYRGGHIPSRAFRILQNFTANDSSVTEDAHQLQINHPQINPQFSSPDAATNRHRGPPSEQSEPEPRKYMGGNIPSRSFRMLQAMTSLDPNADMERVFMISNKELVGSSIQSHPINSVENVTFSSAEPQKHQLNNELPSHIKKSEEETARPISSSQAPSILIDKYEEEESNTNNALGTAETNQQSEMNNSDYSGLINSGAEIKGNSEQDIEVDTEFGSTHHHCRLLRLLSGDLGGSESVSCGEAGTLSAPTSTPSASETETPVLPPNLSGVRLRIRSLRSKDRIPSRVFRSLQHEFDSSTEDITQSVFSSPPPLSPQISQITSGMIGHSGFFRYSRLYASVTPETPSSATSELESFFSHHQNPLH